MAATFQDDEGGAISDINVVPLVDVVLVLLIVFMITVPAVVGTANIEVNLPETQNAMAAAMGAPSDLPLHLALKRNNDGVIQLYREGQLSSEQDLRSMLSGYPAGAQKPETFLAADRNIPYGEVVKVIDLLTSLGLTKLSLDTKPVPKQ